MTPVALHRRPDLLKTAAGLMQTIWPEYYGSGGIGDAQADVRMRCRTAGLPFGMMALTADNAVAGVGALERRSYGALPGEEPWLVGLCVTPELRKAGVATGLVAALMRYATNAGFDAVFATIQTATGLLTQLGWQRLRVFGDAKGQWDVLRVAL